MRSLQRVVLFWCEDRSRRGATGEDSSQGMKVFIVFQEGIRLYDVMQRGVLAVV